MAQALIGATAKERRPKIVAELRARMTLTPEALVAVQAGLATRPDSLPTVATIDAPVLAIAGGEDPGVTPAEMEVFQAAPGGCEFHLIPDVPGTLPRMNSHGKWPRCWRSGCGNRKAKRRFEVCSIQSSHPELQTRKGEIREK